MKATRAEIIREARRTFGASVAHLWERKTPAGHWEVGVSVSEGLVLLAKSNGRMRSRRYLYEQLKRLAPNEALPPPADLALRLPA